MRFWAEAMFGRNQLAKRVVWISTLVTFSLAVAATGSPRMDVRYKTTPEGDLHIDLHYPEGEPVGEYPVVVYTHGGGWTTGDKGGARKALMGQVTKDLNGRGFCVVAVQYRLWKKGGGVAMRDCVTDAKDAIRYLARHREALHVNTDRVYTFGDSAGGQIAQMLLLSPPELLPGDPELAAFTYRAVAGVSWYGPCDFEKTELFNHDGRPGFRDRFGPRILPPGADAGDRVALYREMSPVNYLHRDSPPLLMIQGDGDTTIPVHHAIRMKEQAVKVGAPVETLIVRNAGHNWRQLVEGKAMFPSKDEIVRRTVAFLTGHEARTQPIPKVADRLPAFSWDTLPRYLHVRKSTAFTPEELRYLAKFPLITFEKTTGSRTFGSTDAGTIKAATAVKAINPSAKILFYRNVLVHYPGYSFDAQLESIGGWSLVDRRGGDRLVRGRVRAYDLTNNRLRKWWTDTAVAVCRSESIDGLFLDGNVKVLSPYLTRDLPEGKKEALAERYGQMMRATRRALGPEKLMVANLVRAALDDSGLKMLDHFDGSYLEAFEHPVGGVSREDYIAKGIAAVQKAARNGKIIALTLHVGESGLGDEVDEQRFNPAGRPEIVQERIEYCLALFLVMAERHSYLDIHDGYDVNATASGESASRLWLRDLPEYRKPLGPPLGPARKRGYEYTRQFEHAEVWLDVAAAKGTVTWK